MTSAVWCPQGDFYNVKPPELPAHHHPQPPELGRMRGQRELGRALRDRVSRGQLLGASVHPSLKWDSLNGPLSRLWLIRGLTAGARAHGSPPPSQPFAPSFDPSPG